jgi:hypothetical protein
MPFLMLLMSASFSERTDFTVLLAQSQHFAGGTVWSATGANYHVELSAERKLVNVRFLSVWVGGKRYTQLSAVCNTMPVGFSDIDKGETIILKFTALRNNRPERYNESPEFDIPDPADMEEYGDDTGPPFEFSGEALICYLEKGIRRYLEIPSFTKLNPQLRP